MASYEDDSEPVLFAYCLSCGVDLFFGQKHLCECRVASRDWLLATSESAPRLPSNYLLISTDDQCVVYQEPVSSVKKDIFCVYSTEP